MEKRRKKKIVLMFALTLDGIIGYDDGLPWDVVRRKHAFPWQKQTFNMQFFRKVTEGSTVILGRITADAIFKSLGGPLPNRENIVITKNRDYRPTVDGRVLDDVKVGYSLEEGIGKASNNTIYICGGRKVYAKAEEQEVATDIVVTLIHVKILDDVGSSDSGKYVELPDSDLFSRFELVFSFKHPADFRNQHDTTVAFYELKK